MSLLPQQRDNQNYGFFGYRGAMVDMAIRKDDPAMLQECIDRDFVDADCQMLSGMNVAEYCERRGYVKCAALLRSTVAA